VKKVIGLVVLGIGGLAAAIALTVGALALAGSDVGSVVQPTLTSESGSQSPRASEGDDHPSSTPSPSVDDHGGASGSRDSPGSDNSGPGSSGSGSSGSGSGSSGPGSGDSGSYNDD